MSDAVTGCSRAWTCPSLAAWRSHIERGDFRLAERSILENRSAAADEARDLMHRLRYEWSLTTNGLFEKLAAAIPDVTRDELDAWTQRGAIESKLIDGELRYFRREPRNLLLFDREARARRPHVDGKPLTPDRHDSTSPIVPHLVDVVSAQDASPHAREVLPVRTRFTYELTVKPDRPAAKKGSVVRAWLPYPQEYRQQRDVTLIESTPLDHRIAPEGSPHRTIYFAKSIDDPSQPLHFSATFEYTTSAVIRGTGLRHVQETHVHVPEARATDALEERPPHIVFTDDVRAIVRELSADSPDQTTLAKRIWNWVDDHIPWRAEHEYCLIPSIIEQSLRLRGGDCGVAALTLITLCRCAGIPARWQSGWTTDPHTGGNMHDWAEIYLENVGWIPIDASYGKKQHDDPRVRDFYFGGLDRYRLIVNADYGQPLIPAKKSLRSEPLDFQRGEVEIDGRNLYFDEWDWSFRFEHTDL